MNLLLVVLKTFISLQKCSTFKQNSEMLPKNIIPLTAENNITEIPKKEWSAPFFEVISKDVIKGGMDTGGVENAIYHS
jgi:hypothetical protein